MFLDDLDQNELEQVENIGVLRKSKKGSAVIQEGSPGTSFALIISGRAQVRKDMRVGQHKSIVELGPGDLIGEVGFLGVETRSASVVAVSDCDILEFSRESLEALIASQPMIGLKLYRGMARELAGRLVSSNQDLLAATEWALGQDGG